MVLVFSGFLNGPCAAVRIHPVQHFLLRCFRFLCQQCLSHNGMEIISSWKIWYYWVSFGDALFSAYYFYYHLEFIACSDDRSDLTVEMCMSWIILFAWKVTVFFCIGNSTVRRCINDSLVLFSRIFKSRKLSNYMSIEYYTHMIHNLDASFSQRSQMDSALVSVVIPKIFEIVTEISQNAGKGREKRDKAVEQESCQ